MENVVYYKDLVENDMKIVIKELEASKLEPVDILI